MQSRVGEDACTHFRIGRYYRITEEWFFSTREDLQIGPFSSRDEAEIQLISYLRHISEAGVCPE